MDTEMKLVDFETNLSHMEPGREEATFITNMESQIAAEYMDILKKIDETTATMLNQAAADYAAYGKLANSKAWVGLRVQEYEDKHIEVLVMVKMVHRGVHSIKNLTVKRITNVDKITYVDDLGDKYYSLPMCFDYLSISRVVAAIIKLVASEYDDTNNSIYNNIDFLEKVIKYRTSLNHLDKLQIVDDKASLDFLNEANRIMLLNLHDLNSKNKYEVKIDFCSFDPISEVDEVIWGVSIMNGTETVATKAVIRECSSQLSHFMLFDKNSDLRDYCDRLAFSIIYPVVDDLMALAHLTTFIRYFEECYPDHEYMDSIMPNVDNLQLFYKASTLFDKYPDAGHLLEFLYVFKEAILPAMKFAYPDFVEEEISMETYTQSAITEAESQLAKLKKEIEEEAASRNNS